MDERFFRAESKEGARIMVASKQASQLASIASSILESLCRQSKSNDGDKETGKQGMAKMRWGIFFQAASSSIAKGPFLFFRAKSSVVAGCYMVWLGPSPCSKPSTEHDSLFCFMSKAAPQHTDRAREPAGSYYMWL